jgi:ABC-type glycerol-3-phosphate transport system permease component
MNTKAALLKKHGRESDFVSKQISRILLIVLVVINIYPLLFTLITSLKTADEFYGDIWSLPSHFYIGNYINAFVQGHIGEYFFNSIAIAAFSLLIGTAFGTLAAYALARLKVPFVEAIVALLIIVQILPTESVIMPLYIFMSKLRLINIIYMPITLAYIGWLLPGTIVILKNFFQTIPVELLESARMDGSGELNTMLRIIMPLTKGALATCMVLNFCFVWGELMWAQIATLTSDRGIPLTVGLLNFQGQYTTDWGLMTAAICMILVPLFVTFVFTQKYFVEGLTAGAVKG